MICETRLRCARHVKEYRRKYRAAGLNTATSKHLRRVRAWIRIYQAEKRATVQLEREVIK